MTTGPGDDLSETEPPSRDGLDLGFLREHIQPGGPGAEGPAAGPALIEDEPPSPAGLDTENWLKISKQRHMNETRRTLALGLFWLVCVLAVVPSLALVFSHWTHFKADNYRELSLVFTPVVALASAAFGFFFASDERHRDL
ncbi:hypothetical protein [Streptomyces spectabilis]|uniref:Transmembrane protein n=1 Tax=Streptomyces spectabilis TaxID=68270 RepID=A0A5P2XAT0_STRST|nr:hypothetical protein [Streptomyces spectabilis]MBB5106548.1 hypothetical protein [Streptomyces spectabilis]MCI3903594.1 hypothetical protein [Streptomyces spectabilis]QEV60784.1 hypothetical protein CP982_20365 [Streptomyces spectabilis]GGV48005.1 hypothetical protein GCM10010245_75410 [Streptomyces spectabilis]